jgi:hypothetical protein
MRQVSLWSQRKEKERIFWKHRCDLVLFSLGNHPKVMYLRVEDLVPLWFSCYCVQILEVTIHYFVSLGKLRSRRFNYKLLLKRMRTG